MQISTVFGLFGYAGSFLLRTVLHLFFCHGFSLNFQSYLHSELKRKSRVCQNIHHVISFQNSIRIQACFRAYASKIMQHGARKLKSPVNIGLNF